MLFERYGLIAEAEKNYRASMARESRDPLSPLALARFLGRQNRTEEALALCDQARKSAPTEAALATGVAILGAGKTVTEDQQHRVEGWITEALRQQPGSLSIRLSLTDLCNQQRRYEQAASIYREILGSSPDHIAALNNLAWILSFQPRKENEALSLIDHAIELAGAEPSLLDTRAVIQLNHGQAELAIRDLGTAIASSPQLPEFHFHLARAHQAAKKVADARKALHQAEQLGLKPDSVDPRERDSFLKLRQELSRSPDHAAKNG